MAKLNQDLCLDNIVIAVPSDARSHSSLDPDKTYIIDFGQSLQLDLGPGCQPAIELPDSQVRKPPGMKHFDPYSWDMYCVGTSLELHIEVRIIRFVKCTENMLKASMCFSLTSTGHHESISDSSVCLRYG